MTEIFDGLDKIPWADLDHAYGSAADVPDLLRALVNPDPKVHSETMHTLYGNVFHQGTRYPATPYVIPFLRKLCADRTVPERYDIIYFWGSLISGYFNVQERPVWSDGKQVFWYDETKAVDVTDPYELALVQIYQESLKGYALLWELLADEDFSIRANAAWVIACLPTKAQESIPRLEAHLQIETSGWVRAAIAFTLGELHAIVPLQQLLAEDQFLAVRCMAACQLARIQPTEPLLDPLLQFVQESIAGYEDIPGAGGKSTGDAAFAIGQLPISLQQMAIPALCEQLVHARTFDTLPYVNTLLTAAFPATDQEITELTELQRYVLSRMVQTDELWSIGNLHWAFKTVGLTRDRNRCAALVGVDVVNDEALRLLRSGLFYAQLNFFEKSRPEILQALAMDPTVFERVNGPDECWLLYAKAFAGADEQRALDAYQRAIAINPTIARKVEATWQLADLLKAHQLL